VPPHPRRLWTLALVGSALVLLIAAGYALFGRPRHVAAPYVPPPPGCQAGTGVQAIPMSQGQAAVAATIAGVAARNRLPIQAVIVAYAAALQESQLQDLDYGDRDSVGVFQQRPSQGWGTTAELEDPVYATAKFFAALVRVPRYTKLPVAQAAQDVQHSADGSAYGQWGEVAGLLAGYFTGAQPAAVSCWFTPTGRADLAAAERQLTETFGPQGRHAVMAGITTARSGKKGRDGSVAVVRVRQDAGWTVASWLVANAQDYGIGEVRYAGYEWTAADGSMGWQHASGTQGSARASTNTSIVAG
jgi:hypothetical protein